eukprot:GEMP01057641.1.p1 GENE.GEMP01057641.1~~GEMP01057641.1.p1  ORF type:complete len:108 (-),score=3.29 GEMP01057641.1:1015-1338(-)
MGSFLIYITLKKFKNKKKKLARAKRPPHLLSEQGRRASFQLLLHPNVGVNFFIFYPCGLAHSEESRHYIFFVRVKNCVPNKNNPLPSFAKQKTSKKYAVFYFVGNGT